MTVGYLGLACIVAAIVGGGVTLFGGKFPLISSPKRQVLLALFGAGLCVAGFAKHEVERCTDWQRTTYSNNNPNFVYNVADPSADRIVSADVDTVLDHPGGGQIFKSALVDKSTATGATGTCAAQEDTTSNGKCRLRVRVSTALIHWGDCK